MTKTKALAIMMMSALLLASCGSSASSSENDTKDSSSDQTTDSIVVTLPPDSSEGDESQESAVHDESVQCTPLMWRMTNDEGHSVTFMGSMHALDPEILPFPDNIYDVLYSSDVLAVECDIAAYNNDLTKQLELFNSVQYEDGDSLKNHLSESTCKALEGFFADSGMNYFDGLATYKPWYIESLCENLVIGEAGLNAMSGVDVTLLNSAKEKGIDIYEVESIEFQMDMLKNMPDEIMDIELSSYSKENKEALVTQMRDLYDIWRGGDLELTEEYLLSADEDLLGELDEKTQELLDQYNKTMLTDRNIGMADAAEKLLKEHENTFYVVGLAHFIGDDGVIALLKDRGYEVELVSE